jgi:hypothetical protein
LRAVAAGADHVGDNAGSDARAARQRAHRMREAAHLVGGRALKKVFPKPLGLQSIYTIHCPTLLL